MLFQGSSRLAGVHVKAIMRVQREMNWLGMKIDPLLRDILLQNEQKLEGWRQIY